MKSSLEGSSAFRYLKVWLEPGETINSEAGAMASMESAIDIRAQLFGGLFGAVAKKYLGGESLFVNEYQNKSDTTASLQMSSGFPGDVGEVDLRQQTLCLQPGSYLASTSGLDFAIAWGGLSYLFAGEGLFKLKVTGSGKLWITCYGALVRKEIRGEYIVDTGHLVAFEPHLSLTTQFSGGLFSSLFGGEGLVTKVQGEGVIYLQSRSVESFTSWLVPRL